MDFKVRTHRDFCCSLSNIFLLKTNTLECIRREMVKQKLIGKSVGRSYSEITEREAVMICMAAALPMPIPSSIELLKSVSAIPYFLDDLSALIKDKEKLNNLNSVTISANVAEIEMRDSYKNFFANENGFSLVSLKLSKEVFLIACKAFS